MSLRILVNNAVNDLRGTLDNNDIMYRIVQDLIGHLGTTNIVTPKNKSLLLGYLHGLSKIPSTSTIAPVELKNIDDSCPKNLLLLTILYYLSDLNKYDFHLINFGMEYGLRTEDLLVLLLLNDIHSINVFCHSHGIHGFQYYTIASLKKLSALHKVEFNF